MYSTLVSVNCYECAFINIFNLLPVTVIKTHREQTKQKGNSFFVGLCGTSLHFLYWKSSQSALHYIFLHSGQLVCNQICTIIQIKMA